MNFKSRIFHLFEFFPPKYLKLALLLQVHYIIIVESSY